MPEPSAELVLIAAILSVYLDKLSKKKRVAFLRDVGETLEWFEEYSNIVRIRPKAEDRQMAMARRTAAEWFRRMVGVLVSRR